MLDSGRWILDTGKGREKGNRYPLFGVKGRTTSRDGGIRLTAFSRIKTTNNFPFLLIRSTKEEFLL